MNREQHAAAFLTVVITLGMLPLAVASRVSATQWHTCGNVRVRLVCNYGGRGATPAEPGIYQVDLEGALERFGLTL